MKRHPAALCVSAALLALAILSALILFIFRPRQLARDLEAANQEG